MPKAMILKDEIIRLREAKGWEQIDLARRSGVKQQTLSLIESGKTKSSKQIAQLAEALEVPVEQIDSSFAGITIRHAPRAGLRPANNNERPFPYYASAEGGDGSIIISWDAIETSSPPLGMETIKGGYGMYIVGESMEPRYERGDKVLVNPHLPPRPGNDVLLFQSEHGETKALVKRLVRPAPAEWIVTQFNPNKTFRLARSLWVHCHVIVGRI